MFRFIVLACGLMFMVPAAAFSRNDFSHGDLEPIAFVAQVVQRARGYGKELRLEIVGCNHDGCKFRGEDDLSVTISYRRALDVRWITSSGPQGAMALLAAVETLLQDEGAARKLVSRVPAALVEKPLANWFDAEDYTVFTYVMGRQVTVMVDPTKAPKDYRPKQ